MKKRFFYKPCCLLLAAALSLLTACGTAQTGAQTSAEASPVSAEADAESSPLSSEAETTQAASEAETAETASTVSLSELAAHMPLPETITLEAEADSVSYPAEVTSYASTAWIDFSSNAPAICEALLGEGYETLPDNAYQSESGDTVKTLDLSSGLSYSVNFSDGKGSALLQELVDYSSARYDSQTAQKNGSSRANYSQEELEDLPLEDAVAAVTEILNELGISNIALDSSATLDKAVMQAQLEARADSIESVSPDTEFTSEDECYLLAFRMETDGLPAFTYNENSSMQGVAGVEIYCFYGRGGLLDLHCRNIPDTTSGGTTAKTVSLETAWQEFLDSYAVWQKLDKKIVSVELEYVVYQAEETANTITRQYVPAWVFCVEYTKSYPTDDGGTVYYVFHDYAAVDATTAAYLGG